MGENFKKVKEIIQRSFGNSIRLSLLLRVLPVVPLTLFTGLSAKGTILNTIFGILTVCYWGFILFWMIKQPKKWEELRKKRIDYAYNYFLVNSLSVFKDIVVKDESYSTKIFKYGGSNVDVEYMLSTKISGVDSKCCYTHIQYRDTDFGENRWETIFKGYSVRVYLGLVVNDIVISCSNRSSILSNIDKHQMLNMSDSGTTVYYRGKKYVERNEVINIFSDLVHFIGDSAVIYANSEYFEIFIPYSLIIDSYDEDLFVGLISDFDSVLKSKRVDIVIESLKNFVDSL